MQIENLEVAIELKDILQSIDRTLGDIKIARAAKINQPYGCISQYSDHSGFNISLDGIGMGIVTEMIDWLEHTLKIKRKEVLKKIESL